MNRCFNISSPAITIGDVAFSRSVSGRDVGAASNSLLELAYKLRRAEFRVYNTTVADNIPVPIAKAPAAIHFNLTRDGGSDEIRENATVEISIGDKSFLSSFDLPTDLASSSSSLKSIQDRYRLFKASFPRCIESESVPPPENCLPVSYTAVLDATDSVTPANSSQDVVSSQKVTPFPVFEEPQKRYSCDSCSYQTDSKSHLLLHRKNVHPIDGEDAILQLDSSSDVVQSAMIKRKARCGILAKRFKCDTCVYSTDCLSHLRRHQGCVHNKMMSYWCYICKKEFSRSEKTKAHFLAFHPNVPYNPRKIRKISPLPSPTPLLTETETTLEENKEIQIEEPELLNKDCEAGNVSIKSEIVVEQNVKVHGKGRDRQYFCPKCNYISHGQWHMKRHMTDVHETVKEFGCKVCCYAASRQHRIISHMRSHGEMFCLYCDYSNANLDIFKRHFSLCDALHRIRTVVRCHVCQIDCADPTQLKAHINETHSVILHSCDLCPYYTDIPDEIYSHSRLHLENELVCKLCNLSLPTDDRLNDHLKSNHVSELPGNGYSCVICGHKNVEISEVISHVQLHEAEVFCCHQCTFKCTATGSLQLHQQYHHGTNPTIGVDDKDPAVADELAA